MKTVFKPTSKKTCTLTATSWKNEAFLSSLLPLSWPDLNNHESPLTLPKNNTKIPFLPIYRINAARRSEVLGKTTVDVKCQKFAMHKLNLNICTSTFSSFFLFQRLFEPLVCNLHTQICLPAKVSSTHQGVGKRPFTMLHVLQDVFCSSYEWK